jgi:AcrR family transcriptional regulator
MSDVALAAGVSKALVSYHLHDKDSLLVALVDAVGADLIAREEAAVAARSAKTLDAYWVWLREELHAGDLRVLSSLAAYDSQAVRAASRRVARRRREIGAKHVEAVFAQLGMRPRMPAMLVAETLMAFADGLAVAVGLDDERDPRPAFDVLWLALLSIGE